MVAPLQAPVKPTERLVPGGVSPKQGIFAALLVMGCLGIAGLSYSIPFMVVMVVVVAIVVIFGLLFANPSQLLTVAIVGMWFDSSGVGELRFGRVVAGLIAIVTLFRMATTSWRPRAYLPRAWFPTAIFASWAILSAFWSGNMGAGWLYGISQLYLGVAYFCLVLFYTEDERHIEKAFTIWAWVGVGPALLSDLAFFGFDQRGYGLTGGANNYAMYVVQAIAICAVLYRRATGNMRLAYVGLMMVYLSALIASGSRSGLVSMGLMIMYICVTVPGLKMGTRIISTVLGGLGSILGLLVAAALNPDRFSFAGFFGDAGAGRLDIWNVAISAYSEKPVTGVGIGTFRTQVLDLITKVSGGTLTPTKDTNFLDLGFIEAHNQYLTILLDLGIVGLILWAINYTNVLRNLWGMRNSEWADWVWACGGVLLVMLAAAVFGLQYNQKFQWMTFGLSGLAYYRTHVTSRSRRVNQNLGLAPWDPDEAAAAAAPAPKSRIPAQFDFKLRYPFRWVLATAVLGGAFLGGFIASTFGDEQHIAVSQVLVVNMDNERDGIEITDGRLQTVLTLGSSDPFLEEVRARSGVDLTVPELRELIGVTRPGFSAVVEMNIRTPDEAVALAVGPVLAESLDVVVDRARAGSGVVLANTNRSALPGLDSDYTGPLYIRLFDEPFMLTESPRVGWDIFLGGLTGLVSVILMTLVFQGKQRLSSSEDIEKILDVPFVGRLPRLRYGREKDSRTHVLAAAWAIEEGCPDGASVVAITGYHTDTLHSCVSLGLGAGLASVHSAETDRPVLVIDLDLRRRALSRQQGRSRSAGVAEYLGGEVELSSLVKPVSVRRSPRSFRRLTKEVKDRLFFLPAGRTEDTAADGASLVRLVTEAVEHYVVVLNLPEIPGPLPLAGVLEVADAAIFTVLDGWTLSEAAQTSIDSMSVAARNRVGFVLIDN